MWMVVSKDGPIEDREGKPFLYSSERLARIGKKVLQRDRGIRLRIQSANV